MKPAERALKYCPKVRAYLEHAPSRDRFSFEWLVENGLGGVFRKYLRDAQPEVLSAFFSDFARADLDAVLEHGELLASPPEKAYRPADLAPVRMSRAAGSGAHSRIGRHALASGSIAALAFSGGAATRFKDGLKDVIGALPRVPERLKGGLDASAPKGCFPIGPVEGLNFYEMFIGQALETAHMLGRLPHCLIMTSGVTLSGTKRWLSEADLWGLPHAAIGIFSQGENPRFDEEGLPVVLKSGRLLWSGDGHGGIYKALKRERPGGGCLYSDLADAGVKHLIMFNIDNAAFRPFHSARIGAHVRSGAALTMSVVRKTDWKENVGVACLDRRSGRFEVVEYNTLPPSVAGRKGRGGLEFSAGHVNVNIMNLLHLRSDIEPTIYTGKKVEVDGKKVLTSTVERLNQHITRRLDPGLVKFCEVEREAFFMPTKNPTGVDSAITTFNMLCALWRRWLKKAGTKADTGAFVELHPCVAMEEEDLKRNGTGRGWRLEKGSALYLCAKHSPGGGSALAGRDLTLEEGATLIVRAGRPYGDVSFDPETRLVKFDPKSAGKLRLGNGVTVKKNTRVVIDLDGDAECVIPDGKVFDSDVNIKVKAGESKSA